MNDNEKSPGWLLPVIVTVLIGSVLLIFVASRRTEREVARMTAGGSQGEINFTAPDITSPTDPVDPCSLISQSKVEEILNTEVSSPISEELDLAVKQTQCVFGDPEQSEIPLLIIEMVFESTIDPVLLESDYNVYELYRSRRLPEVVVMDVPDIEDVAFWGGVGQNMWNGLHIASADVYLRVNVSLEDDEMAFGAAQQVAAVVLENLFE